MPVLITLHTLAAVLWVGGLFFAYVVLRPAAGDLLPEQRLPLWGRVFGRFLPWVWIAVITLLVSGYWMTFGYFGGMATAPLSIHLMQGLGIVMVLLFLHLYFAPYRRFTQALRHQDHAGAAKQIQQMRWLVGTNLLLGLATITVAVGGRYL